VFFSLSRVKCRGNTTTKRGTNSRMLPVCDGFYPEGGPEREHGVEDGRQRRRLIEKRKADVAIVELCQVT